MSLPEREEPAAEQGAGDAHPARPAARRRAGGGRRRGRAPRARARSAPSTAPSASAPTTSRRTASPTTGSASRPTTSTRSSTATSTRVIARLRRRATRPRALRRRRRLSRRDGARTCRDGARRGGPAGSPTAGVAVAAHRRRGARRALCSASSAVTWSGTTRSTPQAYADAGRARAPRACRCSTSPAVAHFRTSASRSAPACSCRGRRPRWWWVGWSSAAAGRAAADAGRRRPLHRLRRDRAARWPPRCRACVVHAVELDPGARPGPRATSPAAACCLHQGDAADALPDLDGTVDVVVSQPALHPARRRGSRSRSEVARPRPGAGAVGRRRRRARRRARGRAHGRPAAAARRPRRRRARGRAGRGGRWRSSRGPGAGPRCADHRDLTGGTASSRQFALIAQRTRLARRPIRA